MSRVRSRPVAPTLTLFLDAFDEKLKLSGRLGGVRGLAVCVPVLLFAMLFHAGLPTSVAAQTLSATLKPLANFGKGTSFSGALQAGDGNVYTYTSVGVGFPGESNQNRCSNGTNDYCSSILQITPTGAVNVFHAFEVPFRGSNYDGEGVTSLIEGSDGNFYGTAGVGGAYKNGTIFKITKAGALTVLYAFPADGSSGISPASLIEGQDGNFYGITTDAPFSVGGIYTSGTAFEITPTGTFTLLHTFLRGQSVSTGTGDRPTTLLQGADGNFYGATFFSDYIDTVSYVQAGYGTVFSMTPGGTVKTLHNFAKDGSDNFYPQSQLVQGADGSFYGVTIADSSTAPGVVGHSTYGTIYSFSPSGSFKTAYTFGGTNGVTPNPLTVGSDGGLYGVANSGGNPVGCTYYYNGCGVFFRLNPDGTEQTIYSFLGGTDGALPSGALVQTGDGNFIGTTGGGYSSATGVFIQSAVYQLAVTPALKGPIQLSITKAGMPVDPSVPIPANTPLTLSWNVLNAYSGTARNCHASVQGDPPGAGAWTGRQAGTVSASGYSGSATITPTLAGIYVYALTCGGKESAFTAAITVAGGPLKIDTTSLPDANVAAHYLHYLAGEGGVLPYTWAVTGLPDGLALEPFAGSIAGKPTKEGDYTLAVQLTDSSATPLKVNTVITLHVAPPVSIASLEFTQSIQVYQALADLKASIASTGGPPMPVIANKPAVVRVYFSKVDDVTPVTLQVTGAATQTKTLAVQPNCEPTDQRSHANLCPSVDIYFTPPAGTWSIDLLLTNVSGDELEHETLNIQSRTTQTMNLIGTRVCDSVGLTPAPDFLPFPKCGDPMKFIGQTVLLSSMMPTTDVTLQIAPDYVRENFEPIGPPGSNDELRWLSDTVSRLNSLARITDFVAATGDVVLNRHSLRLGAYRTDLANDGATVYDEGVGEPLGRAAMVADTTRRFHLDAEDQVIAHETAHTLGLQHTNLPPPAPATTAPGCYAFAHDSGSDWPPFTTNNVQSSNGLEYAFNVAAGAVLDPVGTYDLMSYCYPRWLSPKHYAIAVASLGGGTVAGPFLRESEASAKAVAPIASTSVTGQYWQVSGSIETTGAKFAPIFKDVIAGTTDPGIGTYSIEEQDSSGTAVFTRHFTPITGKADIPSGADTIFSPIFAEALPVTPGAVSIVVKDTSGMQIGRVTMATAVPLVTFVAIPVSGKTGIQPVTWTSTNPNGGTLTSRLLYSSDAGTTWSQLGDSTQATLGLDLASLPGSNGTTALLKVLVSDGANTGSATSGLFAVTRHIPTTVQIALPTAGMLRASADPLQLIGFSYDPDDGMLSGSHLVWSSDLQGSLGSGSPLTVTLVPGNHKLSLTATDSDGNSIATTTNVTITGAGPTLSLTASTAGSCTNVLINAAPGVMGAALSLVQYSLDNGGTYSTIPLGSLPFTVSVPGSGSIKLVARVFDASGQSNAQSVHLTITSACPTGTQITPVLVWNVTGAITYGIALGIKQLNAASSVPGTFVYSPASGSVLPVGSQTLTATFTPTDAVTYATASVTTTITVTPGLLTIVPVNASRAYGFANPSFSFVAGGFVNGDTAAMLSGTPLLTTSASISSPPGSYPIVAAAGSLATPNYTFSFGAGSLTVTSAASMTSALASAAVIAPGTNEIITATVSPAGAGTPTGNLTFLDGNATLATTPLTMGQATFSTTTLAAGAHTVTVNYGGDSNFTASSSTVVVTVTPVTPADFTFVSSGAATLISQSGQSATSTFAITPAAGGYPGVVSFTVAGLPPGASATFSPSSIPALSNSTTTITLTIQAPINAAEMPSLHTKGIVLFVLLPLPLLLNRRRYKLSTAIKRIGWMVVMVGVAFGSAGCADRSITKTYNLVVTATSGSISHSSTVFYVVNYK